MNKHITWLGFVTHATFAFAQLPTGSSSSLCNEHETTYFSCKIEHEKSYVSVCAKDNTAPDAGYVQYRYGTQSKIDFTYPPSPIPPAKLFSVQTINHFRDGIGKHIEFRNHEYTYIVSNAVQPAEVGVFRNDKLLTTKSCEFSEGFDDISNDADLGIEQGTKSPLDSFDGS